MGIRTKEVNTTANCAKTRRQDRGKEFPTRTLHVMAFGAGHPLQPRGARSCILQKDHDHTRDYQDSAQTLLVLLAMALPTSLSVSVMPPELELIASEHLVEIIPLVAMEKTAFISVLRTS